jgi:hypothetical protein
MKPLNSIDWHNVPEEHSASIFMVAEDTEDERANFLWNIGTYLPKHSYLSAKIWRYILNDSDLIT